jgi:hypothetical protein
MKRLWILGLSAAAVLTMGALASAATITVDQFGPGSNQFLNKTGIGAVSSSLANAGILGGERDALLSVLSGVGSAQAVAFDSGGGVNKLYYSQDALIFSQTTLTYDGTDGSSSLDPDGLGGYDLTGGGTEFGFELGLSFMDSPYTFEITVYDASNSQGLKWSREKLTVGGPIFSPTAVTIPYGHFGDAPGEVGPAGPVSFGNVGAVTVRIQSVNKGADVEVDYLKTSVVPEPASIVTAVLGAALCGFGYLRRRNRSK